MNRDPKQYARIRRRLWFLNLFFTAAPLAVFIGAGGARGLAARVTAITPAWPLQTALYAGAVWFPLQLLLFPLAFWGGHVVEHRFGLSTQPLGSWLKDYAKGLAIGTGMGGVVLEGLEGLLRFSPGRWWFWAAIAWVGWSALLTRVFPTLLLPLFYRQSPLKDRPLEERLRQLVARCGAQVSGIFEVNLSRTTRKANAMLCGLGRSRRVLVSDTLLSAHPPEEVEVVLAHELGHHHLRHLGILLLASGAATAVGCFSVDRAARIWAGRLGVASVSDLAALPFIALGLIAVDLALLPVMNGLSRILEAQADRYALRVTGNARAFASMMRRLAQRNLAELSPPRWVEWLLYDHPPIAKRIALAEQRG